jgi:hypothetical protein
MIIHAITNILIEIINILILESLMQVTLSMCLMMMMFTRLQHGKGFHNLVYMSYVEHINPAPKARV